MRAEATIALVGVQPTLIHVPPTNAFSISAVFQPALASFLHNGVPPCPEPIIMASKVFIHQYRFISSGFKEPHFLCLALTFQLIILCDIFTCANKPNRMVYSTRDTTMFNRKNTFVPHYYLHIK